jgi:hypothetical protein
MITNATHIFDKEKADLMEYFDTQLTKTSK